MAEILEAVLHLDITTFTAALQQAAQQVTAFAQAIQGSIGASSQAFQQQAQLINQATATIRQHSQVKTQAHKQDLEEMEQFRQALRLELDDFRAINRQELQEVTSRNRLIVEDTKKTSGENIATYRQELAQIKSLADQKRRAMMEASETFADDPRLSPAERLEVVKQTNRLVLAAQQQGHALEIADLKTHHALQFQAYKTQADGVSGLFESMVARVGTSLRTLGGYLAASFLLSIPAMMVAWAKETAKVDMQMQSLTATFRAITGSAAGAQRELNFLRTTANRVGVDFLDTASQFRNLEAAARGTSLEGAKVKAIFEAVVTATRVMGLTSDQTARALLAIEQMMSKGVITSEELRKQLSQAIPGSVGIMARALGVGTEELGKMMKNADLLSEEVLPKFGAQIQKELGPGLEHATKQAAAAYARFGNEMRDISSWIGDKVNAVFVPLANATTRILENMRKANDEAARARAQNAAETREGRPIVGGDIGTTFGLPEGQTKDEERAAFRLNERIGNLRKILQSKTLDEASRTRTQEVLASFEVQFNEIEARIKERTGKLKDLEIDEFGGKATAGKDASDAMKQYKKEVEEILNLNKQLPKAMQEINAIAALLPTTYGKAEERLRAVKKLQDDYLDAIKKNPEIRGDPAVQKAFAQAETMAAGIQKEIDLRKEQEKNARDYAAESKRKANEALADLRTMAEKKEKMEEKLQLMIAETTEGETEKKIQALNIILNEAIELNVNREMVEQAGAAERVRIYADEAEKAKKFSQEVFNAVKRRSEEQQKLEDLISETAAKGSKTRLDDFLAAEEKKRAVFVAASGAEGGDMSRENRFEAASAKAYFRLLGEEQEKAAKQARKPWLELADSIESALGGAFQSVLNGSKNLFEGIRDAFLKLLARLAADAIAKAIIIPVMMKMIGTGGDTGSGAWGGAAGFGAGDFPGASGSVGTGSNGVGGAAVLSAGASVIGGASAASGAMGGPTVSSLLTQLIGPSSAGVLQALAAGIAVGMISKELLKMVGLSGTGGSVLAGAAGGATAGFMIGTVFPVIGNLVGAIGGAIVGALGGYISSLFGKKGKQPGFDIEGIQPGQVTYEETIGLRVTQNFKILDDFHQKLGTDYEDFIKEMDNSINAMMEAVLSQISGATPEVQRALVDPLNNAFRSIAEQIANYPKIGGEQFKDQLEVMMEDFAQIFSTEAGSAIGDLLEAVKKVDPVIQAFTKIIDSILEDIKALQQQQQALNDALNGNIASVVEALYTPAGLLLQRKRDFDALLKEFNEGNETTQIQLAPKIGDMAEVILALARTVLAQSFGDITGVQAAIKQVGEAGFTPAQTLTAREGEFRRLADQFRAGNDVIKTALTPQMTQLALEIMNLAGSIDALEAQLDEERKNLMKSFPGQQRAVSEALFSPAQTYLSSQSQLGELVAQFYAGDTKTQLELEPQIAQLAANIMQLAASAEVLGQDPQLLRRTQADLLAVVIGVQNTIAAQNLGQTSDAVQLRETVQRTQTEVMGVLREVQWGMGGAIANAGQQTIQALWATAGQIVGMTYTMDNGIITATYQTANGTITAQYDSAGHLMNTQHYIGSVLVGHIDNTSNTVGGWSNALYQQQSYLIAVVSHARDIAWVSYVNLINVLWTEVGLAQEQIRLLVNSLYHLETVDAVVAAALRVLGEMNARLGNPLNVRTEQPIGEQLQRDSLYIAQQAMQQQGRIGQTMIALLAKPAFGLDWGQGMQLGKDVVGFQHGGFVSRNMIGFLHAGERVVPEWENRSGGGGKNIQIHVYGGTKDPAQIAEIVIAKIEARAGRLQAGTIQTSRR